MKNFSQEKWNQTLAKRRWESLGETEEVDTMVEKFTECMKTALNEIAPMTRFTIKPNYKEG